MRLTALACALFCLLASTGCSRQENLRGDHRGMEQKLYGAPPTYDTRYVMSCPKCGAPQRPYRVSDIRSFYRCEGTPPRFPYHQMYEWDHKIDHGQGEQ